MAQHAAKRITGGTTPTPGSGERRKSNPDDGNSTMAFFLAHAPAPVPPPPPTRSKKPSSPPPLPPPLARSIPASPRPPQPSMFPPPEGQSSPDPTPVPASLAPAAGKLRAQLTNIFADLEKEAVETITDFAKRAQEQVDDKLRCVVALTKDVSAARTEIDKLLLDARREIDEAVRTTQTTLDTSLESTNASIKDIRTDAEKIEDEFQEKIDKIRKELATLEQRCQKSETAKRERLAAAAAYAAAKGATFVDALGTLLIRIAIVAAIAFAGWIAWRLLDGDAWLDGFRNKGGILQSSGRAETPDTASAATPGDSTPANAGMKTPVSRASTPKTPTASAPLSTSVDNERGDVSATPNTATGRRPGCIYPAPNEKVEETSDGYVWTGKFSWLCAESRGPKTITLNNQTVERLEYCGCSKR